MPFILGDPPTIQRVMVRREFTRNLQEGHGTFWPATIIGIRCQEAASLQFQVRFDNPEAAGAMFCLPIQALCWKPCELPDVELVQPWDTFSNHFTVHEFALLKRGAAEILNTRKIQPYPERIPAKYLWTLDFCGNALADDFEQHKQLHIVLAEPGWIAALPNNRVLSVDTAFAKPCATIPRFDSLAWLPSAECRVDWPDGVGYLSNCGAR